MQTWSNRCAAPKLPWSNQSFTDPDVYEQAKQAAKGNTKIDCNQVAKPGS